MLASSSLSANPFVIFLMSTIWFTKGARGEGISDKNVPWGVGTMQNRAEGQYTIPPLPGLQLKQYSIRSSTYLFVQSQRCHTDHSAIYLISYQFYMYHLINLKKCLFFKVKLIVSMHWQFTIDIKNT